VSSSANPSLPSNAVVFTVTLNAVAPASGTPTGAAQFKIDNVNAGGAVSLASGVARYTNSSLSHGSHTVVAEYVGDSNFTGTTNSLSPLQLINTPPVAAPDTIERTGTNATKVSIATLLSNDSDQDGDPLTFQAVSPISANGGTVVSNAGWIFYTPPAGATNADSFTYTIADGFASPVMGLISVNVIADNGPSPNLTITIIGANLYSIHGDGIPGRTYRIQYSDTPDFNWQELGSATADSFGVFQLNDAAGSSQRFYRSAYP
jgi:hypothetical protein